MIYILQKNIIFSTHSSYKLAQATLSHIILIFMNDIIYMILFMHDTVNHYSYYS